MEKLSQLLSTPALNSLPDGFIASVLVSFGTGIGALPILFTAGLSDRMRQLLLSIGGGVMLSAAAFSLLLPAITLSSSTGSGISPVIVAFLSGSALFYLLSKCLPEPNPTDKHQSLGLFVLAIALHHLPEGLAVGVSAATTQNAGIAIGVALQNMPEGLMVALAMKELGYGVGLSLTAATVSGWLEPLGGWIGTSIVGSNSAITPMSLALAAGAMLFVVVHELLPKIDLKRINSSSVGLASGVLLMAFIEQLVG